VAIRNDDLPPRQRADTRVVRIIIRRLGSRGLRVSMHSKFDKQRARRRRALESDYLAEGDEAGGLVVQALQDGLEPRKVDEHTLVIEASPAQVSRLLSAADKARDEQHMGHAQRGKADVYSPASAEQRRVVPFDPSRAERPRPDRRYATAADEVRLPSDGQWLPPSPIVTTTHDPPTLCIEVGEVACRHCELPLGTRRPLALAAGYAVCWRCFDHHFKQVERNLLRDKGFAKDPQFQVNEVARIRRPRRPIGRDCTGDAAVARIEHRRMMRGAVELHKAAAIPRTELVAVVLRVEERWTFEEIGAELGVSTGSAEKYHRRGLRRVAAHRTEPTAPPVPLVLDGPLVFRMHHLAGGFGTPDRSLHGSLTWTLVQLAGLVVPPPLLRVNPSAWRAWHESLPRTSAPTPHTRGGR
jgi:hypothetical protein